jgi:hypothetical protein
MIQMGVARCRGCTALNQPASLGDPTAESWTRIVAEASEPEVGTVKVRSLVIEQYPDFGRLS